jgi:hypothetical protein
MSKDKALKLALEALEKISKTMYHIETPPVESLEEQMRRIADKAVTAIKQALAQPAPVPVCKECNGSGEIETGIGMMACTDCPPAAPVQERTDYEVHLNHCNLGECEGVCKYGDDDCPALKHADMKAKWDRPTPPAAQPAPVPTSWMEMVTVNLLREGVNKHKARELAEHFYGLAPAQPAPVQEHSGWQKIECPICGDMAIATDIPAARPAPVQEPVAYLFTNVQSGDIEASTNLDHKEGEREMWYREPLVSPTAAQPAPVHPDSARIDWLTNNPLDALDIFGHVKGSDAVRWIRQEIDNAMLKKDGATHD